MEIQEIWRRIVESLSTFDEGSEILNKLLRDFVRYALSSQISSEELLKEVAFYRLERDPESAWSLLKVIKHALRPSDISRILAEIKPLNISFETLLDALMVIRSVEEGYRGIRSSIRLIASYLLAGGEGIPLDEALDAAVSVGDPEAYRAILRVYRGDDNSLLTQAVAPKELNKLDEDKIPHGLMLRTFNTLSIINKGLKKRLEGIDKRSLERILTKFETEFSVASWNPYTAGYFDRLRAVSRLSPQSFLDRPYPTFLLELERLAFRILLASSSEIFKEIRSIIRRVVQQAQSLGVLLTSNEILPQTFVMPIEDRLIGARYRGRELGRYVARLISLLVPDLKELIYLSDEHPDALFGIHSLYPEEIYVGRYIHVGIEAYLYGREDMVKTKKRIFKKTLSNLVEKFKDSEDDRSKAKAAARAVSLAEGRAYLRGLVPYKIRKTESSSLFQQLVSIIENIDDRLVRLYAFMRALWAAHEGLLHLTLVFRNAPWSTMREIVAKDLEELSPLIVATVHTLSNIDGKTLSLLSLSLSLRLMDAMFSILRVLSVRPSRGSEHFYKLFNVAGKIFENVIPLIQKALEHMDVFKIVEYPSFNPIFSVVLRRYQIVEGIRRAALYMYLYGFQDEVPEVRRFVDERTLTAMEPWILRYDPDVLAVVLPVVGGKRLFKLKVGIPGAPESRRRL